MVVEYLPPYSAISFSRIFRFELSREPIWSEIFKDYTWLKNAKEVDLGVLLLGYDLIVAFYGRPRKPTYLVLILPDWEGDFMRRTPKLLDCLQPHVFDENTNEVTFKNSDIILNIDNCISGADTIKVNPKKIFSQKSISSAFLVWGDLTLHKIPRKDVIVVKRKDNKKSVEFLCAVVLSDNKWLWDEVFQARDCPPRLPLPKLNPAKRLIT